MNALISAIAAIDDAIRGNLDPKQQLVAAKCRGLIAGYHQRWISADYEPLEVEQYVDSDLWNPTTNAKSRSFRIAGKLDVTAMRGNRRVVFDHKTTSEDITDLNSPYWRQLVIDGQVSHYMLLEWLNGRKCDEAVWDVVRKPQISPRKLTQAECRGLTFTGNYLGQEVSAESIEACKADQRETLEMYQTRLALDCITERPQYYFQRRSIPRLDAELHEYAVELWEHSQELILARRLNRHSRNPGACFTYGSPCKFLGICSGHDSEDSDNWKRKAQVNTELPIVDGDGRDVLTTSRIRMFQTCRKKHYFSYELGIERIDEEERESLFFGTLFHLALEAWWLAIKSANQKEQHDNHDNGSPVTEIGTARTQVFA